MGCAMIAVVLGIIGLFLDSQAATIGAVGLVSLLCSQAALFLYRTSRYVDLITVRRVIMRRPVAVGTSVEVEVRVDPPAAEGLLVRITDLPPSSVVYDPGRTSLVDGQGIYVARFLVPGVTRFRGLKLMTANRFFSTTLTCTAPRYVGDKISVISREGDAAESLFGGIQSTKELNRLGIPRGEGVSGFHPFRQGDELTLIDWKLTAKHRKPYVREPTAAAGGAPLLVVDLPVRGSPEATVVILSASEAMGRMVREQGRCSLLLISGGDAIDFRRHERDSRVLYQLLGLQVHESFQPLYRLRESSVLRSMLRSAENEKLFFSQRYAAAMHTNLSLRKRFLFEEEIDLALRGSEQQGVIVYTASSNEVSHLNLISEAARRRKSRLVIRLPRSLGGFVSWLSPYPVVELI
ncbi:hypothetical protein DSECCO2_295040 [anaerobic digester metagenome]